MIKTLFSKIFLWSVLVQFVAVGTILVLVTAYLPQSQEAVDNAFSLYADTAVPLYERFGAEALDKFLARTGESTLLQLKFAATNSGQECVPAVVGQGGETTSSIAARGAKGTYCLTIHAKSGALPESPESRRSRLQITILVELLSCALLSYFIARYLSRPISELRQAATRLAKGDLRVRVGEKFAGRRDEAADLVHEFDQMAERVAELIKSQQRLISDVSHELKSPLARMNMALDLARRDAGDTEPRHFERMQREIESMSYLAGELLTLAQLDAITEKPLTDRIDLADLIAAILADVVFESPDRADDLAFDGRNLDLVVPGDRALLARAVENVVRNAVFYTAPGDTIRVMLAHDDARGISIEIADQGPGVPPEKLPYLFDPFYRVDDARGRKTGGAGVGLAICRRAVRLHGGSVIAGNVSPHGLSVVIGLPSPSVLPTS